MRTIDVFYAFPSVLLAIALSGALGAGITNALVSLTIVFVPPIVRVAESVTTQVRNRDYVEAARATGAGGRSEEHTSELQSLMRISYAVFCLNKKVKNVPTYPARHLRPQQHTPILQPPMPRPTSTIN